MRQLRLAPVRLDQGQQFVVVKKSTQTAPVVSHSIMAFILQAHDERDHFPIDLAQGCRTGHCGFVQTVVSGETSGVRRMDRHDVIHSAVFSIDDLTIQFGELAGRVRSPYLVGNRFDPGFPVALVIHTNILTYTLITSTLGVGSALQPARRRRGKPVEQKRSHAGGCETSDDRPRVGIGPIDQDAGGRRT